MKKSISVNKEGKSISVYEATRDEMELKFPTEDFDTTDYDASYDRWLEEQDRRIKEAQKKNADFAIYEIFEALKDGKFGILDTAIYKNVYLKDIEEVYGKSVVNVLYSLRDEAIEEKQEFDEYNEWLQEINMYWWNSPFRHYSYAYAWRHRGDDNPYFEIPDMSAKEIKKEDIEEELSNMDELFDDLKEEYSDNANRKRKELVERKQKLEKELREIEERNNNIC